MATKTTLIFGRNVSFQNDINKELSRIENRNGKVIDVHFQVIPTRSAGNEYAALIVYKE